MKRSLVLPTFLFLLFSVIIFFVSTAYGNEATQTSSIAGQDFGKSLDQFNAIAIPPSPAPISMLELKYSGYFDALPTPIQHSDTTKYPYSIIGRMAGHSHGTGVMFGSPRTVLTAGHLFINLRTGQRYAERPVWYGQVNTPDDLPNVEAAVGRKVVLHSYGLGYGLMHFKKNDNFICHSERVDTALVILYEDGSKGKFAPKIKGSDALKLLESEQPKMNIGYISTGETYGYAITNNDDHPWLMREGKISQHSFEQSPWPFDYLAIMKTKTDDLKRIHHRHPTMVVGPGMSGSAVWVKDKNDFWQVAGVYIAGTSKENVEKYLQHDSQSPIITVVYLLGDEFEQGPFQATLEILGLEANPLQKTPPSLKN